jgi:poly(A) polymerase
MFTKAKEILNIINKSKKGAEARFVGGAVRNSLISKDTTDIDIATNLTPEQVTEVFESKKIRVIPTGIAFGTVTVVYDFKNYEITTLRKDVSTDGRHAQIAYTDDWQEDAKRRDFTFNALYMDIDGKIYDYFNGEKDLHAGIVRFIGNAEDRIKEDYLRILRLFRFHAYFGKEKMLPDQLEKVKTLCDGLDMISGERIRTEVLKLLISPESSTTLDALQQMLNTGILQKITGFDTSYFRIEDIRSIYGLTKDLNPIVSLSTILTPEITDDDIEVLSKKWRLSNKESNFMYRLKESLSLDFGDEYQIRRSARTNGKDEFYDYILLSCAKGRITKQEAEQFIIFAREFAVPEFPLKSEDLIKLGVPPSKKLGELLRQSEEIWEKEGYRPNKEELLKKVKIN